MELWFTEPQTSDLRWSTRAGSVLHHERTAYQEIVVLETPQFGRLLALDGYVQTTDRDEFIYHEMLAHVPATAHPAPERALVVGGGDGGTVRELLRHDCVRRVDLVEIDGRVIDVCRRFFPVIAAGLDDPRVAVRVGDGIAHVGGCAAEYDLILVDCSEPVGPGVGLFAPEFYAAARRALRPGGILAVQSESPFYNQAILHGASRGIEGAFGNAATYLAPVPTYPGGLWSFTVGWDRHDPRRPSRPAPAGTRYYTPEVHAAAFALPPCVAAALRGEGAAG